jgi:uncharacterized protein (TIGR00296 family)
MFDLESGVLFVKVARTAVEKFFENKCLELEKTRNKKLNQKRGVFVTIKKTSDHSLRGCIGFISPAPLYESIQRAAVSAAFQDPRFQSLAKKELENVTFEISVMTEPVLVSGDLEELKQKIEIGRDGLIISNGPHSGLLLPQVPIEQNWDIDEFLHNLCHKASLTPDFLKDENTKLWKFQCQIFTEREPSGHIEEIEIKNSSE